MSKSYDIVRTIRNIDSALNPGESKIVQIEYKDIQMRSRILNESRKDKRKCILDRREEESVISKLDSTVSAAALGKWSM